MAASMWRRAGTLALVLLLGACAAPPKPLYRWGGYQGALYEHLKGGGDPGAMIARLEAQAQRADAEGAASPPGLHGHLAVLYSKTGDDANMLRHLQIERQLFPESATFIDFLLKNAGRPAPKP